LAFYGAQQSEFSNNIVPFWWAQKILWTPLPKNVFFVLMKVEGKVFMVLPLCPTYNRPMCIVIVIQGLKNR
jgi:hypothetical protein